jgi:hypothetical protein
MTFGYAAPYSKSTTIVDPINISSQTSSGSFDISSIVDSNKLIVQVLIIIAVLWLLIKYNKSLGLGE